MMIHIIVLIEKYIDLCIVVNVGRITY